MSNDSASQGQCSMRGACGTKGWLGQPLPCPYDGPAVEVSCSLELHSKAHPVVARKFRVSVASRIRMWTLVCRRARLLHIGASPNLAIQSWPGRTNHLLLPRLPQQLSVILLFLHLLPRPGIFSQCHSYSAIRQRSDCSQIRRLPCRSTVWSGLLRQL